MVKVSHIVYFSPKSRVCFSYTNKTEANMKSMTRVNVKFNLAYCKFASQNLSLTLESFLKFHNKFSLSFHFSLRIMAILLAFIEKL